LASLPAWEQFLLGDVTILDRALLFQSLRIAAQLYLASDGGAADCKGLYGCVFATNDTLLAECGGCAEGADPKSFRAESYGMLAILRLTFHLQWFYVTRNPTLQFTVYTDSESLIRRLTASLRISYIALCRTLFSEADIELQILSALASFAALPHLVHVEGQQDTKYPGRPLSWEAQLNHRCDGIA
jgi:hypothetical protein